MSSDQERGLYNKFLVVRSDGSSKKGGKHEYCKNFVLDITHDRYAIPALQAYIRACRDEYPKLAADLEELVRQNNAKPKV